MSDTVLIGARVEPKEREALRDLAKRRQRTISGELRLAIATHLQRAEQEEKQG